MKTYLDFWGLTEKPFGNCATEEMFHDEGRHGEALERMLYLACDGGMCFGLLTGEVGCGKTMVLNVLKSRLPKNMAKVVMFENSYNDFDEILRSIILDMDPVKSRALKEETRRLMSRENRYELMNRFRDRIRDQIVRLRKHLIVIIDEAQQLDQDTLLALKNLTNITEAERNHMTIILAGQPELKQTIRHMPQVDQRIGIRYHLDEMSGKETASYIDAQMKLAGRKKSEAVFTEKATRLLHGITRGNPREINRICRIALDMAFASKEQTVNEQIVAGIARDLISQSAA